MELDIKVSGLDEVDKQLRRLGAQVAEAELHRGLMSASLPAFKRAKNLAPGSIAQSIQRKRHRSAKTRRIAVSGIAATGSAAAGVSVIVNKRKAPHAHLIDQGTKDRRTKGKGGKTPYKNAYRGRIRARNFMMKAWNQEGGEKALSRFQAFIKKRLRKLQK